MGTRKKVNKKIVKRVRRGVYDTAIENSSEQIEARKIAKLREQRYKEYMGRGLVTVGVRFSKDPSFMYTYLIDPNAEPYLGMEVVAKDGQGHSKVCYIVRVDTEVIMPDNHDGELKKLQHKVVDL